ncbi:MAG TPA: hypothetical protein VJZ25_03430 [Gemmatimonadaceae bacterium]|nr:hypothetical protein [Gemmatimonadaceae bacterium]
MTWTRIDAAHWVSGPLTIRRMLDERQRVYAYEVFSTTRFVREFANLAAAMEAAQQLGWERVAS